MNSLQEPFFLTTVFLMTCSVEKTSGKKSIYDLFRCDTKWKTCSILFSSFHLCAVQRKSMYVQYIHEIHTRNIYLITIVRVIYWGSDCWMLRSWREAQTCRDLWFSLLCSHQEDVAISSGVGFISRFCFRILRCCFQPLLKFGLLPLQVDIFKRIHTTLLNLHIFSLQTLKTDLHKRWEYVKTCLCHLFIF